ncbi:MAG: metal ABC transporter ATP-binding protein [Candidatus Aminicenantales bacterium]
MDLTVAEKQPLITLRNVSFSYAYIKVLEDVSFNIESGDFLAIIGPNGSGKTTLIKIILGLLKPSSGEVVIMRKAVDQFKEWTKIGYVPQKATHIDSLFPASVKEVVEMALSSRKGKSTSGKVYKGKAIEKALEQVGMEEFKNRRIGTLSGGQQQRVFIARAIVNQPQVLFLDEPTTGVDAETQERFYEMLDRLNKNQSITIVLVTHDIGIVNRHVRKVACLNKRLIYHGSHSEFCRSEAFKEMLAGGHHLVSHQH